VPELPKTLVDCFAAGLCLPWCGAGISIAAGLPTWSSLSDAVISETSDQLSDEQQNELQELFDRGQFEEILDFCRDLMGESEYRDFLARTFDVGYPTELHHAIVKLPVAAVLTTNYDRLLETAFAQARAELPKVLTAADTASLWKHTAKREFFILKIHGDIIRPETVILTSRDYTQHVFGNVAFMTFLQRLVVGHSLLFIGTSLSDIYLRRVLEETTFMTKGVGLPHYALLSRPGQVLTKTLKDRFNIRVVPYDPFGDTHEVALIGALQELVRRSGKSA
jgi:NAD-dependent SIR2 family protein deacetylase